MLIALYIACVRCYCVCTDQAGCGEPQPPLSTITDNSSFQGKLPHACRYAILVH